MAEYISSFITGFDSVIGAAMKKSLPGARILRVYDGLVYYSYNGNVQNINHISFLNNSYLVYKVYKGNSLSFDKMVSQASVSADHVKITGAFRFRFSKEIQFVKVRKQTTLAAEKLISGKTDMRVDRVNPQNEYWFIIRRENIGFFGKLLRKRKTTEKALHKGELRPEFALLLCVFAEIKQNEVLCDPFAGYGAIPIQAIQSYRIAKMYVSDNDKNLVNRLKSMDVFQRCARRVSIKCEDAMRLESVKDHEISLVITDPPWGYYENIPDIQEFYNTMFRSFKRVLKAEGRAVVLSARKNEVITAVKNENGYIVKQINTLINGNRGGVFMIQFLK